MEKRRKSNFLFEKAIVTTAALIFIIYFLTLTFIIPDLHISWDFQTGRISRLDQSFLITQQVAPEIGDHITHVGGVPYSTYMRAGGPSIFGLLSADRTLQFSAKRGQQVFTFQTQTTPASGVRLLIRMAEFYPSAMFLAAAILVFTALRPRASLWRILLVLFCISAVWLSVRIGTAFNILLSYHISLFIRWLWVAAYLHLMWNYPQPLGRFFPGRVWLLYLASFLLAWLEWFQVISHTFFLGVFGLALLVGLVILILHLYLPRQRRESILLVISIGSLILLTFSNLVIGSVTQNSTFVLSIIYFLFPLLPLALLFPIFRRQFSELEPRMNTIFIQLMFGILILVINVIIAIILLTFINKQVLYLPDEIILSLFSVLLGVTLYPRFNRWTQRVLLGIVLPSDQLLQQFASKIMTSLDQNRLGHVLLNGVLPAFLIRQCALIRLDDQWALAPILVEGVNNSELPSSHEARILWDETGGYRSPDIEESEPVCPWARVIIRLEAGEKPLGLLLFGRRDPDDYYAGVEISFLQSIADQMALALLNIDQAHQINTFHLNNIQHYEEERMQLARDLHDDVLSLLAFLRQNNTETSSSQSFLDAYDTAITRLRAIVYGLRPPMLEYGLYEGLLGLADEFTAQSPQTDIRVDVSGGPGIRYPQEIENHLYRIIHEACLNAILHGQADEILIAGWLKPDVLEIVIQDNGNGFEIEGEIDLIELLARHHYGLANMMERAHLIGADVYFQSAPEQGTSISVSWKVSS